ncbi:diaminobutyrate acetyltransferase [Novosphingobium sp. RD2P27]|uniref:L-2,4-diaminobutyric acid acetyltransferase n=1 Tax=Novosphingobium kalidii TaxID=3230299 RepID=A0ABV2CYZ7_9SPHN
MEVPAKTTERARDSEEPAHTPKGRFTFRCPRPEDGFRIASLIARCPPLDTNSVYCNLLQCSDFADTCVVAERNGEIQGWISGYRPPSAPEKLFIWQVAVDAAARGEGLAGRMLDELLARPAFAGTTMMTTTITEDNAASWRLFGAFARRHGAEVAKVPRFEREVHFGGAHDTEWEARIAPLPTTITS